MNGNGNHYASQHQSPYNSNMNGGYNGNGMPYNGNQYMHRGQMYTGWSKASLSPAETDFSLCVALSSRQHASATASVAGLSRQPRATRIGIRIV